MDPFASSTPWPPGHRRADRGGPFRSNSTDDVACWFIDTEYDGESFVVRRESGRIAVKVINHHGDEVMKVLEV